MRNDYIAPLFETDIIEAALKDRLINHHLEELIKDYQITQLEVEKIGQVPFIRIIHKGLRVKVEDDLLEENLDGTPSFGDLYTFLFDIEVVTGRNQQFTYNGTVYKQEKGTMLIAQIVKNIFNGNRELTGTNLDIKIHDFVFTSSQLRSPHLSPDFIGVVSSFAAEVQMKRRY